MLRLPNEIILHILTFLIPLPTRHGTNSIILRSSDPVTKTLLSLAVTCRATSAFAVKNLYTYCLYIDSLSKIYQLAATLSSPHSSRYAQHITSFYLTIDRDNPNNAVRPVMHDDIAIITTILSAIAPTLTCLIMDIPIGALRPSIGSHTAKGARYHNMAIDDALIAAFQSLTKLEVFVSLEDDLHCVSNHLRLWKYYPQLRVFGMSGFPSRQNEIWIELRDCMKLETLIVLYAGLEKRAVEGAWGRERDLNVVLLGFYDDGDEGSRDVVDLRMYSTEGTNVEFRDVQFMYDCFGRRDKDDLKEWVRTRLLKGEDCMIS